MGKTREAGKEMGCMQWVRPQINRVESRRKGGALEEVVRRVIVGKAGRTCGGSSLVNHRTV